MRFFILIILMCLCTSVYSATIPASSWGTGGGGGSFTAPIIRSSGGAGGYTDYRLIVQYPLQSGLLLYKLTAYKYGL